MKKPKRIYYLHTWIYEIGEEWVVDMDNSTHKTLTSAKAWVDYLSK